MIGTSPGRVPAPPRPETELSNRWTSQCVGWLGAAYLRTFGQTWRVQWDQHEEVDRLDREGLPYIHSVWHGHILPLIYTHRDRGLVVLVSQSKDGEFISQVIHRLGYGTVRGSTSRGSLRAMLEMARLGERGHPLGITPDGPRGPRHQIQKGLLVIASRSGLPLVPLTIGVRGARELKSWDRFEAPWPFARFRVVAGKPIYVPSGLPMSILVDEYGPMFQQAMEAVETRALAWRDRTDG